MCLSAIDFWVHRSHNARKHWTHSCCGSQKQKVNLLFCKAKTRCSILGARASGKIITRGSVCYVSSVVCHVRRSCMRHGLAVISRSTFVAHDIRDIVCHLSVYRFPTTDSTSATARHSFYLVNQRTKTYSTTRVARRPYST